MAFAWKAAGLTYNRFLAVSSQAVRRSLKEGPRLQAERRGQTDLKVSRWENGKQGEAKSITSSSATAENPAEGNTMLPNNQVRDTSRVTNLKMIPKDITAEFTEAASALKTGELVKDEYFTLFEAVGALEIMDSKMDSGYLGPSETEGKTIAQALEDDYDVHRDLLPEEVLGIMDQLLCHETLFTSIYIDRLLWPLPKTLDEARFYRGKKEEGQSYEEQTPLVHRVLRAYCLSLIKACDLVNARVSTEYFYEEEDFVTQLYNRNLLSTFDSDRFRLIVDDALSWIENEKDTDISDEFKKALSQRLIFRREFLKGLDQDLNVLETRSMESFQASIPLVCQIEESMPRGKPVEEAFSLKLQRKLASTVPPRPMVNVDTKEAMAHLRRLCQDAADVLQMLDYRGPYNLRETIWALQSRKPQPSVYIRSIVQSLLVNDMRIIGSVLVKQFFFDDLAELVLPCSPLLEEHEDVEIPSDPRFKTAKIMDSFVKRSAQPFVDTFRGACLNRSRVRRTLCHTIIDWDNLQLEAEDIDTQLRAFTLEPALIIHPDSEPTYSYPLSSWAYHQKLRQIRLVIQLGFELSIYSPEEFPGMYWYLSHVCGTHLAHLDRIRTFVSAAQAKTLDPPPPGRKGKTPEKSANQKRAFDRTFALLDRLTTELIAVDAFALTLHALYTLLSRHNLLPTRSSPENKPYSSDKFRYELRMKPFSPISLPEFIPYEDFVRESSMVDYSDTMVLDRAVRASADAKKSWEELLALGASLSISESEERPGKEAEGSRSIEEDWKKDVKDSLRACIGASIAVVAVKKAMVAAATAAGSADAEKKKKGKEAGTKGGSKLDLNLEVEIPEIGSKARWHDWWAVPRVMEKKAAEKK
ncbi:hypothetical protein FQN54_007724 [Arachnomyces sp. PD_36]|nr:hypothetical protein FQN54_007724 [Arachnomyces sp. PD_36]